MLLVGIVLLDHAIDETLMAASLPPSITDVGAGPLEVIIDIDIDETTAIELLATILVAEDICIDDEPAGGGGGGGGVVDPPAPRFEVITLVNSFASSPESSQVMTPPSPISSANAHLALIDSGSS